MTRTTAHSKASDEPEDLLLGLLNRADSLSQEEFLQELRQQRSSEEVASIVVELLHRKARRTPTCHPERPLRAANLRVRGQVEGPCVSSPLRELQKGACNAAGIADPRALSGLLHPVSSNSIARVPKKYFSQVNLLVKIRETFSTGELLRLRNEFAHFLRLGNNLFRADQNVRLNLSPQQLHLNPGGPLFGSPILIIMVAAFAVSPAHILSRNPLRPRLRISHELLDGSPWPVETWHPLPALGGAGSLRIRRGTLHLLSSRIVDAGSGTGIVPALEDRARRL